jgi:hypothetical protein
MAGTIRRIAGPAFLPSSVGNLYTPPASTIYTVMKHIHFFNVSASPVTINVYIGASGASAAGSQLFDTFEIEANQPYDYFMGSGTRMDSTDFLTGSASVASAVTYTIDGELVVV